LRPGLRASFQEKKASRSRFICFEKKILTVHLFRKNNLTVHLCGEKIPDGASFSRKKILTVHLSSKKT